MTIVLVVVGSLLSTLCVSRIFLWALRFWDGGWTRLAVANLAAWMTASVVARLAILSNRESLAWDFAVASLGAQVLWFALDAVRHLKEASEDRADTPSL